MPSKMRTGSARNYELLRAVELGVATTVQDIVNESPAAANAVGQFNYTPAHIAALCGYKEIAKILVSVDAINLTLTDKFGRSAIDCALSVGQIEIAEIFMDRRFEALSP